MAFTASPQQFIAAVLHGIGAPVTEANVKAMMAWQRAEGGSARFNPFNTTQPAHGASNYNSVGVRNYGSFAQGVAATIETIKNGHYGAIIQALHQGTNPLAVAHAVGASPWGTNGGLMTSVLQGMHGNIPLPQAPQGGVPLGGGGRPVMQQQVPQFHAPVITLPTAQQFSPAQALASVLQPSQPQSTLTQPAAPHPTSYVGQLQQLHDAVLRATT